jgi:hypothetical protein
MRRPSLKRKDFQTSIGQGEYVQKMIMGGLPKKKEWYLVFFFGGKRGE